MKLSKEVRRDVRIYYNRLQRNKTKRTVDDMVTELSACMVIPLDVLWEEFQEITGEDYSEKIETLKKFYGR